MLHTSFEQVIRVFAELRIFLYTFHKILLASAEVPWMQSDSLWPGMEQYSQCSVFLSGFSSLPLSPKPNVFRASFLSSK